ncbi:MAG: flagellin FliC [Betaproteobacteria bacterium]|nr:flagellin FliC [Betaproteobacteria bacterium]
MLSLSPTTISSNFLNTAQDAAAKSLRQLSTGLRINSAADNPAGLAVAVSLSAQATGLLQAATNADNGISLTDTAAGAVGQIGDTLQQMRELAVQAGNGALNGSDRQAIQSQINQLGQQLDQVAGQAQFNGQNLLDGSFSSQVNTGPGTGQTTPISIANLSGNALGIAGLDVTTAAGSASALSAIDTALGSVNAQQSQLGAISSGLSSARTSASAAAENAVAARSRIADTDYAATAASLTRNNIQTQASLKALAMYNDVQKQQVSGLLR